MPLLFSCEATTELVDTNFKRRFYEIHGGRNGEN